MHIRHFVIAVALAALAAGSAYAAGNTLKVVNKSTKTIYHLYLSDASSDEWGDDQFGDNEDDTVAPGGSFTLTDIEPGKYDVKLVTKSGAECEVDDVEFDADYVWTVTNGMLKSC